MTLTSSDARALAASLVVTSGVTAAYVRWLPGVNATTVALTFLLIVLLTAATSRLLVAVIASVAAILCFNYFFLPPVGRWTIADPQNWVAFFALLAVSLVASRLSDRAKARAREAMARRDELARLFDLGRDVLLLSAGPDALVTLARSVARRFDLDLVAIALPGPDGWNVVQSGSAPLTFDEGQLAEALAAARASIEFDARERTYAGHRTMQLGGRAVRLVPLRAGTKPIGLLAAAGRPVEAGTLDTLAGVVAIAIERTQFLEERKDAELTRQSEELKTALLASLGHDLRTPLTAIRVAASNLLTPSLDTADRTQQGELILAEVERLARLFESILDMARIDAGAVAPERRRVHPSEIVAVAREQVEHALGAHTLAVSIDRDEPVLVDPRLTAMALTHLLENAAQYSPPGTTIDVDASLSPEGLRIEVRDRGPGIPAAELPYLFERFFRGAAAKPRASGTGLGLWIARGLLALQQGRAWAENCSDGGTRFTILVPVAAGTAPDEPQTSP